jgi:D-alanyl-D-alanine carboxypeptidase
MTPSESWTAGAIVATAQDVAAFLNGLVGGALLPPAHLARMTHATEHIDEHRSRGLGIVRYDFGTGHIAYGHHGGMPGYTCVAMRTESGRGIVAKRHRHAQPAVKRRPVRPDRDRPVNAT